MKFIVRLKKEPLYYRAPGDGLGCRDMAYVYDTSRFLIGKSGGALTLTDTTGAHCTAFVPKRNCVIIPVGDL